MTGPAFEAFLARLYAEPEVLARFLADPRGEARRAGLGDAEAAALDRIDRDDLALAADSFSRKREATSRTPSPRSPGGSSPSPRP